MDLVADFANLRGIGREEALNAPLPWILFCLHRNAVASARRVQQWARAINLGTAASFGCHGGARAFGDFLGELQALIVHDPFAPPPAPGAPLPEELAAFDRIAARARAAH